MADIRIVSKPVKATPIVTDSMLGIDSVSGNDVRFTMSNLADFFATAIGLATSVVNGLMSSSDKEKLDFYPGGQPGNDKMLVSSATGLLQFIDISAFPAGDMLQSNYDSLGNGSKVDKSVTADSIDGSPGNDKLYGTNAVGTQVFKDEADFLGDMLKSDYDFNSDNKVDAADEADVISGSPGPNLIYGTNGASVQGFFDLSLSQTVITSKQLSSTGHINGCALTINGGDNSKVDITLGEGVVLDNYTDPVNPVFTDTAFAGQTAITLVNLATAQISFLGIDINGTLIQQTVGFSSEQRRDFWWVGFARHLDNATVDLVGTAVNSITSVNNSLHDLTDQLGAVTSGLKFSANGVNIKINHTAGAYSKGDINFFINKKDPNSRSYSSGIQPSFNTMRTDGSGGHLFSALTTDVDPDFFDDGAGSLTAMPVNDFQIQRIYFFPVGSIAVSYGQATYNTISDAEAAIDTEEPDIFASATDDILRTYLIVKQGATDLSDPTEAKFINTRRLGRV